MPLLRNYSSLSDPQAGLTDSERREAAFEEASTLINPKEFGYFSVMYGIYDKHGNIVKKPQRSYPNRELRKVIGRLVLDRDTWISQSRFKSFKLKGGRAFGNLQQINAMWVDIDYYKIKGITGKRMTGDQALAELYAFCDDMNFPYPTTVIDSGRGLQVKWLLDAPILPQHVKPWNAAQRTLLRWFVGIGADKAAMDACRILRVVGTKNTKVNALTSKVGGTDERYSFEYLAEFMPGVDLDESTDHPYSEQEKKKKVAARLAREASYTARLARKEIKVVAEGQVSKKKRFSAQNLNWDRYNDLVKLNKIRGGMPGLAMAHLFYCLNFLALAGAVTSTEFMKRAGVLCEQLGLGELTRSGELGTLLYKLDQKERGETIPFAGQQWPALYTPKNSTLLELFTISDEEQGQLKTIIGANEKKRRRAVRDGFKSDRATYLSQAKDKRATALAMRAENIPASQICDSLSITDRTLRRYLEGADKLVL